MPCSFVSQMFAYSMILIITIKFVSSDICFSNKSSAQVKFNCSGSLCEKLTLIIFDNSCQLRSSLVKTSSYNSADDSSNLNCSDYESNVGEPFAAIIRCFDTVIGIVSSASGNKFHLSFDHELDTHFIERIQSKSTNGSATCLTSNDSDKSSKSSPKASPLRLRTPPLYSNRYLELVLVNDYELYFNYFGANRTLLVLFNRLLGVILNRTYRELDIHVVITGIEVWEEKDQIERPSNMSHHLSLFSTYAASELYPKYKFDAAHLLTGHFFSGEVVGQAFTGTVCTSWASGVIQFSDSRSTARSFDLFRWTLIHEIGHNLGFDHINVTETIDRSSNETQYHSDCECSDKSGTCIMWPSTTSGAEKWSECTRKVLEQLTLDGSLWCLDNQPQVGRHLATQTAVCGNGLVEGHEQCDCGIEDVECRICCNITTCQLTDGSTCSSGACCQDCAIISKKAKKVCRPRTDVECDFDDLCDGSSEFCPTDSHQENGHECISRHNHQEGYCYNGYCNNRDAQCRELFGSLSVDCKRLYEHNVLGNRFGNCGHSNKKFHKCRAADIQCGQLHCLWRPYGHQDEEWLEGRLLKYGPFSMSSWELDKNISNELECRQVYYDVLSKVLDLGLVADGTRCGHRLWCQGQRCVAIDGDDSANMNNFNEIKNSLVKSPNYLLNICFYVSVGVLILVLITSYLLKQHVSNRMPIQVNANRAV